MGKLIKKISQDKILGMKEDEANSLREIARSVKYLPGGFAECGVHRGGSAKILCEEKGYKWIVLFDTFEGMPREHESPDSIGDSTWFHNTSYEEVRDRLKEYPSVYIYKGRVPDRLEILRGYVFSLVNLDLDTYLGTKGALEFFWKRMSLGGKIVVHDYDSKDWGGVKRAVDGFFHNDLESITKTAGTQVMIEKKWRK